MVPTASTQRLTLLMHTCKIRTEDFLDVATSARLSVVVPTCFHVPVRAIGYYCYHFCYECYYSYCWEVFARAPYEFYY